MIALCSRLVGPLAALGLVLALAPSIFAADDQRYVVVRDDGSRITGGKVHDWNTPDSSPRLDNEKFSEPERAMRWFLDTAVEAAAQPSAYLEYTGGDRLPGRVVGYVSPTREQFSAEGPHLLVLPSVALQDPEDTRSDRQLRVSTDGLRRVVWEAVDEPFRPGTLFFRDGRRKDFNALRWTRDGVRILRADGTETARLSELAEIHFPATNYWDFYTRQLAVLDTELTSRVVHLETTDGVAVTSVSTACEAHHWRDRNNSSYWIQRIQPAWSHDPLWVRFATIRLFESMPPDEIPLSRLAPETVETRHALAAGWNWQTNRNVQGEALNSGGRFFVHGFGVQATTRLEFVVPTIAQRLRLQAGLDRIAGNGGSVEVSARLNVGGSDKTLMEPKTLIGSDEVATLDWTPLPPSEKPRRLILAADGLFTNRPSGADPFDIRDHLDWLEPTLGIDRAALRQAVGTQAPQLVAAWSGWDVVSSDPAPIAVHRAFDRTDPDRPQFRPTILVRQPLFTLRRKVEIDSDRRFLTLLVNRDDEKSDPAQLDLLVDGEPLQTLEVPEWNRGRISQPLVVNLAAFLGRTVTIEIRHRPSGPKAQLWWHALDFSAEPPGLRRLFDESPKFVDQLIEGTAVMELDTETPHRGLRSLKLVGERRAAGTIPGWNFPIRERPGLGEYRYLRFSWRAEGKQPVCVEIAHDGVFGPPLGQERRPFRFDFGGYDRPSFGAAKKLDRRISNEWQTTTVDLYEFGPFEMTGLGLARPKGDENAADEPVWFDAIYLARDPSDFDKVDQLSAE
jgi:hypothetical protein